MNESIPGLPSRGPGLATTVLVSALTSAAVAAGTVVVMGRGGETDGGAGGGGTAEGGAAGTEGAMDVPSVTNMPPDAARELLKNRGLLMVIQGERPDPSVPSGWIVEQTPMSGSQVRRGAQVLAKVSSGPERIAIPSVVGRPLAEARSALESAGLRVGPVQETGAGTPGSVTAVSPVPGTRVAPGSEVLLTVAPQTAAAAADVEVPDLRRKSRSEARVALEAVGLRLGRASERYDENLPPRVVIRSDPAAGTRVPAGTEVSVVINEGD